MKILQLTNYPTVNPMHGGQIRAREIAEALRNAGHEVESIAIYLDADFHEAGRQDIAVKAIPENPAALHFLSDYLMADHIGDDEETFERAKTVTSAFRPDVIIVEQPWLFELAEKLAGGAARLIYSSQNIEWRLKRDHVVEHGLDAKYVEVIKAVERHAVVNAGLVVACTAADAKEIADLASTSGAHAEVIVCGNGVSPFSCDEYDVERWSSYFADAIGSRYPIFVSSGHPPNATGFWNMMAPGLTFLRPDEEVVVVGGVCSLLTKVNGIEPYRELNLSRLHLVGQRPKRELQAMVRASHVVLLPISTGEGSNLKTAEALESGCSIVATSKAFRGYEDAMGLPHVRIADTAPLFRRAVREVLDGPRNTTGTPIEIRSRYYWGTQLAPLVGALEKWSTK